MKLTGNTILITGAGSGIGLALAEALVKLDNRVIVAARSPEKLKVAKSRGLETIKADLCEAGSIQTVGKSNSGVFASPTFVLLRGVSRHHISCTCDRRARPPLPPDPTTRSTELKKRLF